MSRGTKHHGHLSWNHQVCVMLHSQHQFQPRLLRRTIVFSSHLRDSISALLASKMTWHCPPHFICLAHHSFLQSDAEIFSSSVSIATASSPRSDTSKARAALKSSLIIHQWRLDGSNFMLKWGYLSSPFLPKDTISRHSGWQSIKNVSFFKRLFSNQISFRFCFEIAKICC